MAVGVGSDHTASSCVVEDGDNVEVDTWNPVGRRSHRVAYGNEDVARESQQLLLLRDARESWSLNSWNPVLNSWEVVHRCEFSCYHRTASPAYPQPYNRTRQRNAVDRAAWHILHVERPFGSFCSSNSSSSEVGHRTTHFHSTQCCWASPFHHPS